MSELETRTYEIVCDNGAYRIDIPADCRVSYGPVIGAAGKASYGGNVLRIWQGTKATERQLALFQNVTSFRDLSLTMKVAAVRKFGDDEDAWYADDGSFTGERAQHVQKDWRPRDELREGQPVVSGKPRLEF